MTLYEEMVAAGAPALPETHFYRVRPLAGMPKWVNVEIRERRVWPLWSKRVGSMAATTDSLTPTPAGAIAWAAGHAHREAFRAIPDLHRFLGDHPW